MLCPVVVSCLAAAVLCLAVVNVSSCPLSRGKNRQGRRVGLARNAQSWSWPRHPVITFRKMTTSKDNRLIQILTALVPLFFALLGAQDQFAVWPPSTVVFNPIFPPCSVLSKWHRASCNEDAWLPSKMVLNPSIPLFSVILITKEHRTRLQWRYLAPNNCALTLL